MILFLILLAVLLLALAVVYVQAGDRYNIK